MKSRHDIIWLKEVDSTNNEAKMHIDRLDNLSVISANCQTAGRGQNGNSWSSNPGENLTFSVVLKYHIQAHDSFVISEIASLAIVDLLSMYGIEAKVKWPNDIYVGNKKICGILVEHSLREKWISHSIVGIGLNINQRNFNVNIPNPTSMSLCTNDSYDCCKVLNEYIDILEEYLERYLHIKGGYAKIRRLFLAQLWRLDEKFQYIDMTLEKPAEFTGIIRGLSDIGQLIIENEKGELKEFAFKEISFKL